MSDLSTHSQARETQANGGREYYSVSGAARVLGVSPSTVWRWIKIRKLPAYRVGGHTIRIRKEDLEGIILPAWEDKG